MPEQHAMTEAEYTAAIPGCCSQETLESHMEMLLCWSITNGKPVGDDFCSDCHLSKKNLEVK